MKKLITVALATFTVASLSAQLRVISTGQVQTGTSNATPLSPTIVGGIAANPDTTATLRIIGPDEYETGGKIVFGNRRHVAIEETNITTNGKNYFLPSIKLTGAGGFNYTDGTKSILTYNASTYSVGASGQAFVCSVPFSAPQYLTVSDSRSKTDIEPLEDIGLRLGEIVPVSYHLIDNGNGAESEAPQNGPRRSTSEGNGNSGAHPQYGFLAQDVREVYPELVYEDSEGNLSLDYNGFIPILVDAVQHLQATVAEQAALIESLQNPDPQGNNGNPETVVASLGQNRPNPFRVSTDITCVIPQEAANAFMCVYDLNGNQKLRCDITDRGEVIVTIEGNRLQAGMYIYTLIIDGNEIDSKRMILTD